MAQLKDSLITGDLRVTGTIYGIGSGVTNINANNITEGILPVARGGTGQTSFSAGAALIGNGANGLTVRSITNLTAAGDITSNTNLITANTLNYWKGTTNVVKLGTVTTGTWHATKIDVGYGGTGRNTLTSNAVITGNGTGAVNMIATADGAAYAEAANGALKFGTLPVKQGGTGHNSLAQYGILLGNGDSAITVVGANTTATKKFLRMTGTGSAGAVPAWDTLVAADIPNLDASKITSGTLAIARGGTGAATANANVVFAGPSSGNAAAPSFRALVAADIPNHSTAKLTSGTLGVARGGTGQGSLTQYGVVLGNGTDAVTVVAVNTSATRKFLRMTGTGNAGAAPAWDTLTAADIPDLSATYAKKSDLDTLVSATDAMVFKGTLGSGGTITALPDKHKTGDTYRVITAASYAGIKCEVGDLVICITDGTAANNAHWTVAQTNIDGAVVGPASATNGHFALFNGTTGKIIQNSDYSPSSFAAAGHTHSSIVTVGDQRNNDTTPNSYNNNFIFQGLKTNSKIGSPTSDNYSYVIGLRGWSDSSGGNSHELAFNNTGIFWRSGATTTWGNWYRIYTTGDKPSIANHSVTTPTGATSRTANVELNTTTVNSITAVGTLPSLTVTATDVVTGGTTTAIPNISKKTVVTGVTKKTVVTGGSTTAVPNISKKTVVTSATAAKATYSSGILTISDGSVTTGDSVTVGTAIKAYTSLTTGDSVTVTTGDSVTVGTAIKAYTALTTSSIGSASDWSPGALPTKGSNTTVATSVKTQPTFTVTTQTTTLSHTVS